MKTLAPLKSMGALSEGQETGELDFTTSPDTVLH